MSKPVTENALVTAWPGSGLPNSTQFRHAHGAKMARASDTDDPDQPEALPDGRRAVVQAITTQTSASQAASLRVSAARPSATPSETSRGSRQRGAAGVSRDPGHEQAAASASAANGIVESGRAEWRSSGR